MEKSSVLAVLFDFGGVLAEEGFRNGLARIAELNSLDPGDLFKTARGLISSCGYLTGAGTETLYWDSLRRLTGVRGSDGELRKIILDGFILRDWMISLVKRLQEYSIRVAILSDQTDWLDELDERMHFFTLFERVFNSYHLGKSKSDATIFRDVIVEMGLDACRTLFIDDMETNVERARSMGLHAIHYRDRPRFILEVEGYFPGLVLFP
jgi:putative hydrolase of the HAD superfamily